MADSGIDRESDAWRQAHARVTKRREFSAHLVAYVVVNAFLVLVWALTGADYFWPVWAIGGWGIALALHAWSVYGHRTVTDADVEAELRRGRT